MAEMTAGVGEWAVGGRELDSFGRPALCEEQSC